MSIYKCLGFSVYEWVEVVSEILGVSKARVFINDISTRKIGEVVGKILNFPKGYPYQYIIKKAKFYGREFYVDERVFIPRVDTERMIEIVMDYVFPGCKILDLGTGSGVIGITIKLEYPRSTVYISDRSQDALHVALRNAKMYSAEVIPVVSDLTYGFKGMFDIVVSNPPYIPRNLIGKFDRKVIYEPRDSLNGGSDGFEITQKILSDAGRILKPSGLLIIETDPMHFKRFPFGTMFVNERFAIIYGNFLSIQRR